MAVLIGCSAFFSASEAALFSLRPGDRRILKSGSRAQQQVATLLLDPERVLSAVLFWNLVVNIAYFAIATIVEHNLAAGSPWVWPLRASSLLVIIFCYVCIVRFLWSHGVNTHAQPVREKSIVPQ